jgi:hypothetical protein
MDETTRWRIGINEAAFRDVNEGIRSEADGGSTSFICECGRLGCNQLIELGRDAYESVRADPCRFAVVAGHELPETEDVVERHDGYYVVEKRAEAGVAAVLTDPRPPLIDVD